MLLILLVIIINIELSLRTDMCQALFKADNIKVNKINKNHCLHGVYILLGGDE